ncbi:RNA polymerase sigma factor [Hymenobacter cellulosilyticus]|uniref:RNA polymerase sigma factor n=1 Tax=Hymenobacter cellulosilyticus TaxID=2932248 RepID=UPI0028803397|nr:RNA polymerase sigma factor [Hymenobacter cellulosilyticus]
MDVPLGPQRAGRPRQEEPPQHPPRRRAGLCRENRGGTRADDALQREQEVATLHRALGRLSAENREVLILSRFQELKYEEIARVMNTTEGAVKVRVHRALNELKTIYLRIEN